MAGAARRADSADDRQDDVLGRYAEAEATAHADLHRLRLAEQQRLRRQHMLDLAGADAERQRAQRAVRRRVAVPADQRRARQREAQFGADDMDDALLGRGRIDIIDAEFGGVALKRGELRRTFGIGDRDPFSRRIDARGGRQIVIGHGQRQIRPPHLAPGGAEPLERLWARHFMDEVAIDVDQAGAIVAPFDDVRVPDLFVKRLR